MDSNSSDARMAYLLYESLKILEKNSVEAKL